MRIKYKSLVVDYKGFIFRISDMGWLGIRFERYWVESENYYSIDEELDLHLTLDEREQMICLFNIK